jgi:hypothetical protein
MKRVLTFAEFATSLDQKGPNLGNSQADVDALAASTEQFTADGDSSCAETDTPKEPAKIQHGGDKVMVLAAGPNHAGGFENNGADEKAFDAEEGAEDGVRDVYRDGRDEDFEDEESALDFETPAEEEEEEIEEF